MPPYTLSGGLSPYTFSGGLPPCTLSSGLQPHTSSVELPPYVSDGLTTDSLAGGLPPYVLSHGCPCSGGLPPYTSSRLLGLLAALYCIGRLAALYFKHMMVVARAACRLIPYRRVCRLRPFRIRFGALAVCLLVFLSHDGRCPGGLSPHTLSRLLGRLAALYFIRRRAALCFIALWPLLGRSAAFFFIGRLVALCVVALCLLSRAACRLVFPTHAPFVYVLESKTFVLCRRELVFIPAGPNRGAETFEAFEACAEQCDQGKCLGQVPHFAGLNASWCIG